MPPRIGESFAVEIDSIAFGGEGIARHGDYVLFVSDVIPGEQVMVKVTAAKRSFGRAVPLEILSPSTERTKPRCTVYGLCGGCQYQHVTYAGATESKQQQIKEVVQRIGGLTVDGICDPIVASPCAYGYRNSITLQLKRIGKGRQAGYIARDNRTFVPVSDCPIVVGEINEDLARLDDGMRRLDHADRIRSITIKSDGERTLLSPRYERPLKYRSNSRLCYLHNHLAFYYGGNSFFQVNHAMIPALLATVKAGLNSGPGRTLLDLYAGVGLFSIALAESFGRVIGVELGREAVECFQENIRENSIDNVTVVRGAVEDSIRGGLREMERERVSVLVDPPREGLHVDVAATLNEASVERLVYVSCNPATLARDLKLLEASFSLLRLTPLDMFPQTRHIEAVAVLERMQP